MKIRKYKPGITKTISRDMKNTAILKAYLSFKASKVLKYKDKTFTLRSKDKLKIPISILAPLEYCLIGAKSADEFLVGLYKDQPHPDIKSIEFKTEYKDNKVRLLEAYIIPNTMLKDAIKLFTQYHISIAYLSYYNNGRIKSIVYNIKFNN